MYKDLDIDTQYEIRDKVLERASKEELIEFIKYEYDFDDYFEDELNKMAREYIERNSDDYSYMSDEDLGCSDFSYYDYIESQVGRF